MSVQQTEMGADSTNVGPSKRHFPSKIEVITAAYIFVTCCSSIGLIISAYKKILEASATVGDVVDNWKLTPITDIQLRTPTGACPAGYEAYGDFAQFPMPDASCGCPVSAVYDKKTYTSADASCSKNQTLAGCFNSYTTPGFGLKSYRDSGLCVKREGEPLLGASGKIRPEPDPVSFLCPTGYRRCGPSSNDASRSVCLPDSITTCPITFAATENTFDYYIDGYSGTGNPLLPTGGDVNPARLGQNISPQPFSAPSGSAPSLYQERSDTWAGKTSRLGTLWGPAHGDPPAGALPVVELKLALVDPSKAPNGLCYAGGVASNADRSRIESAYMEGRTPYAWDVDGCDKADFRWVQYDAYSARTFFEDNLRYSDECSGLNPVLAANTDYWSTSTVCSDTAAAPNRCGVSGQSNTNCASDDDICKNVFYQSKCGSVAHFASGFGMSATAEVGLYLRHQIFWKSGCGASDSMKKKPLMGDEANGKDADPDYGTQEDVENVLKPLKRAVAAALALLIVNVIINLFLVFAAAFKMCLYTSDTSCLFNSFARPVAQCLFPGALGDDEQYKTYVDKQTAIETCGKVAKLVPLIFSVQYTSMIMGYFVNVASQKCSDDLTNFAFEHLATALPASYNTGLSCLVIDSLSVALWVVMRLMATKKTHQVVPESDLSNAQVELASVSKMVPHAVPLSGIPVATLVAGADAMEQGLHSSTSRGGTLSKETVATLLALIAQKDFPEFKAALTAWLRGEGQGNSALLSAGNAISDDSLFATSGYSLAHHAAVVRSEFMECLIAEPFNVRFDTPSVGGLLGKGATPLMLACHAGRTDVVMCLVEKGASMTVTTQRGENCMDIATSAGASAVISYLKGRGASGSGGGCSVS